MRRQFHRVAKRVIALALGSTMALAACAPAASGSSTPAADATQGSTGIVEQTTTSTEAAADAAEGAFAEADERASAAAAAAENGHWLKDMDASVYTEQGESLMLADIAAGKPLVVNFWATWCPYCVEEMPDFQEIVRDYGDRIAFAFVDAGDGQPDMAARDSVWLAEQGLDLPVYYDNDGTASSSFHAWSLPTTAVISSEGEVLALGAGMIDPTALRAFLDTLA